MNLQQEVRLLWRLPEGQLFRECVSPIRDMDRCADSTCAILFLYDAEMEDYRDKNTKADIK